MSEPIRKFIEPSASGPTQKIGSDGVITPGKAHEAQEGVVTNPGVRTVSRAYQGPSCPSCGQSSLRMRMNRKVGQRVYCSNPDCNYDQANNEIGVGGIKTNPKVKVVGRNVGQSEEKGVTIMRQARVG